MGNSISHILMQLLLRQEKEMHAAKNLLIMLAFLAISVTGSSCNAEPAGETAAANSNIPGGYKKGDTVFSLAMLRREKNKGNPKPDVGFGMRGEVVGPAPARGDIKQFKVRYEHDTSPGFIWYVVPHMISRTKPSDNNKPVLPGGYKVGDTVYSRIVFP